MKEVFILTIFDEVKSLVDVPTAARSYGVEVYRGNMALCPFHRERHPSCKLYEDHYYCFGCQGSRRCYQAGAGAFRAVSYRSR